MSGEQCQSIGIDDHRNVAVEGGRQRRQCRRVGAQTRTDDPGLDPTGHRCPGRDDDLRPVRHHLGRRGTGVTDHAGGRGDRGTGAQHRRPGIGRRASQDAHDPLGVLVVVRPGYRPAGPDVGGVETHQIGFGQVQTDIDDLDPAAVGEGMHGFEATEGHGEHRAYRRPGNRPGRHIDTAGDVDRDNRDTGVPGGLEKLRRRRSQRALTGNPHDTVDHEIGCGIGYRDHPAPGAAERGQGGRVGALRREQDRIGGGTTAAQQGRCPQCIPTVVTGAHDGADSAAGNARGALAQFDSDGVRQTCCGTAHQDSVGQGGQQRRLSHADLIGGVVVAHRALFHGDGFGEVTRLVDIVTTGLGHRRREHLQRDRREQRLKKR